MSGAAVTCTHRLTVSDDREQKLNGSPALSAHYDFDSLDSAEILAQLLLGHEIQAPGRWRRSIPGGVREVTIAVLDSEQ